MSPPPTAVLSKNQQAAATTSSTNGRHAGAATPTAVREIHAMGQRLVNEVAKVIVGKREVMELVLCNILSEGNILFEDFPGLAKTVMASTFARASGCVFKRIQFTPDVLPADITGTMVFDQKAGEFRFRPGPVFTNILLADEINRAPPKTQSALLEAMQERQVSVEGTTHKLDRPYLVMATQNPIEQEGTYPLPEAQMDRFLMKLSVGYPNKSEEMEIGRRRIERAKDDFDVATVATPEMIRRMQAACETVHVSQPVLSYIAEIVIQTRQNPSLLVGSSPRGTLALIKAGRAWAALQGRAYITPDDIRTISVPVLAHRVILKPEARFGGVTTTKVVRQILSTVRAQTV
jgi:MoxR-like ATPase